MIIEVGKKYLRRDGKVITIIRRTLFMDSNNTTYYENGMHWSTGKKTAFDLIEEVNDD